MSDYKVATRYAKSLIDLAKEQNTLEVIKADISSFQRTLDSSIALQSLLKNPVVNLGDKIAILRKIFAPSFNKTTMSFFEIIVRKNRSNIMETIAEAFIDQFNEYNNIISATVKTAHPIDDRITTEVMQFIQKQSGKKVALNKIVDPSLIGGLVIQIGDNLYDASIAGKLNKVKQNLLNTYISNN
jgi:F-type H+-transporting ATPase subunit delta